jgi:ATP-dependent DNA helicase RecQ
VEQIARKRDVTNGTVLGHLATAIEAGEKIDLRQFVTGEEQARIEEALARHPGGAMTPVYEALGGRIDYGVIRLVRAGRMQQGRVS